MVNDIKINGGPLLHVFGDLLILRRVMGSVARRRAWSGASGTMYRVVAIIVGALALAGCSSSSDWLNLNLDALKPKPPVEAVRFESIPPGAQVTLPNGQSCLTPCASPLASNGTYTVQMTLNGYQPSSATIAPFSMGDGTTQLRPNPVTLVLTPIAPPKKKVRHRRRAVRKHISRKKVTRHVPKRKPVAVAPAPTQAPSPWPPAQPPQQ